MIRRRGVGRGALAAFAVVAGTGGLLVATASAAAAMITPQVTHVTPGSGTRSEGNWVTVTGAGFTTASRVTFGLVPADATRIVSPTRIVVRAPAHRLGEAYVHVTTAAGRSPASAANRYHYVAPPPRLHAVRARFAAGSASAPQHVDAVSCPTASFCAAVDQQGYVLTFDGHRWSVPQRLDTTAHLIALSCPTASWCTAVDDAGQASTFGDTGWSTPTSIDAGRALSSVSCPNATFCMAVDGQGYVVAYSHGHWHTPRRLVSLGGLAGVSCSSTVFCYAVGLDGFAVRYLGVWGHARKIGNDALTSVSCSSPLFCMLGTQDAGVRTYDGGAWGRNIRLYYDGQTGGGRVESVSCLTSRFCSVAYSNSDHLTDVILDGAALRYQDVALDFSDFPGFVATSCWASNGCLVAGGHVAVRMSRT